ncbi:lasso peptide biosynthesis B2 protein [Clostridium perfringens]|uniref:Lasso peptide biosynthesis B2 protein n=1 Tax=Clostridium perfringens TaxID=1502 RepID=A0AAW9J083_CLOPF|nr:lasso peptide biosynthesis B2 protein [Clostridium perfringens]MBI5978747.1 lasso peptide biosynthesis B2 protein [Clostridium perfringens]MBI5979554.1 lasso peptide biosynthesis B2 protein [Clostridium perfringens]MBI6080624.1 lasso peptide biosynthesis B2 protein [Clostridium perfringens]MBI6086051.1 lasso peptide biosynthesis B2 protein [Clostridium perfringens]MBI6100351.1 lasso peptide biosynthesis B2 protein [Clostridium perfringens]
MKKLSLLIRKIKTFFKIDFESKVMFCKAFILCGFYRFIILNVSFSKVKKLLGEKGKESEFEIDIDNYKIVKEVSFIVKLASYNTPWESKCLVQAMTAQKILNDKGIKTTLYLGVAKEKNNMVAHSWLRYGQMFVTGGNGDLNYKRVGCFVK